MNRVFEFQAGPGSYNLRTSISQKSLVYCNLPRATIEKGPKHPKVHLPNAQNMFFNLEDGPSAHSYQPDYQVLWTKGKYPVFDRTKRADYFTSFSQRSPGPVYQPKKLSSTAVPFPRAGITGSGFQLNNTKNLKNCKSSLLDTRKLFDRKI
jgi:hypothetical protein